MIPSANLLAATADALGMPPAEVYPSTASAIRPAYDFRNPCCRWDDLRAAQTGLGAPTGLQEATKRAESRARGAELYPLKLVAPAESVQSPDG